MQFVNGKVIIEDNGKVTLVDINSDHVFVLTQVTINTNVTIVNYTFDRCTFVINNNAAVTFVDCYFTGCEPPINCKFINCAGTY